MVIFIRELNNIALCFTMLAFERKETNLPGNRHLGWTCISTFKKFIFTFVPHISDTYKVTAFWLIAVEWIMASNENCIIYPVRYLTICVISKKQGLLNFFTCSASVHIHNVQKHNYNIELKSKEYSVVPMNHCICCIVLLLSTDTAQYVKINIQFS